MWIPKHNWCFFRAFICAFLKVLSTDILGNALVADYEQEGSHPQECRVHALADKHVAVGYWDLVNAVPWFTETGSIHKGAGCYSCLCETFHSVQGGQGMAETRGLAPPKETEQWWFVTWCSFCGKLLNCGSLSMGLSLTSSEEWTPDLLGLLPTPTKKTCTISLSLLKQPGRTIRLQRIRCRWTHSPPLLPCLWPNSALNFRSGGLASTRMITALQFVIFLAGMDWLYSSPLQAQLGG